MITHEELVRKLKKPDNEIHKSLLVGDCDIIHMLLGLSGEVGELIDGLKKYLIYEQEIPNDNIIEELGDIEFFLEGLRQRLGITRDSTIEANIVKLSKRYESLSYSNENAEKRKDKV